MISSKSINRLGGFVAVVFAILISSCNKDLEQFTEATPVVSKGLTLGDTLKKIADDSLYYQMVVRGGMLSTINSRSNSYTMVVPTNSAMRVFISAASGGLIPIGAPDAVFSAFIANSLPAASAAAIVRYNIIPQAVPTTAFPGNFANAPYPSLLNPAPSISSLLRLTTAISSRNSNFVNNIPIVDPDIQAANGYIDEVPAVPLPPSQFLWDRISTDADMTIFKAAIERADSAGPALVPALQNIGANFTVFVPTNQAVKEFISGLTGGLIPVGAPDAVFIGFLQSNSVTTQLVGGLVAYHIFDGRNSTNKPGLLVNRPGRAFSVNFPVVAESYATLLNSDSSAAAHPGLSVQATFTGLSVSAATVKGLANPTASNLLINPTPAPNGTSDQLYLNGVIQKIDQVLRPL